MAILIAPAAAAEDLSGVLTINPKLQSATSTALMATDVRECEAKVKHLMAVHDAYAFFDTAIYTCMEDGTVLSSGMCRRFDSRDEALEEGRKLLGGTRFGDDESWWGCTQANIRYMPPN